MAGRLRRSVRWGIVVAGEFIWRGSSGSPSSSSSEEVESMWEVGGFDEGGVGREVVRFVDEGEVIGDEVGRSSEEEERLSLERCWGEGIVVGGGNESIVLFV